MERLATRWALSTGWPRLLQVAAFSSQGMVTYKEGCLSSCDSQFLLQSWLTPELLWISSLHAVFTLFPRQGCASISHMSNTFFFFFILVSKHFRISSIVRIPYNVFEPVCVTITYRSFYSRLFCFSVCIYACVWYILFQPMKASAFLALCKRKLHSSYAFPLQIMTSKHSGLVHMNENLFRI